MTTPDILTRLVGVMPAVVVVGIFDKLKDAVVGGIEQIAENISDTMSDWATWGVSTMLKILGSDILPQPEVFFESPVVTLFGANYGLSLLLVRGLIVVAIAVTLFAVTFHRRTEFAAQVQNSFGWLIGFGVLFFPLYTMMLSVVREVSVTGIELSAKASGSDLDGLSESMLALPIPNNLALKFLAGLLNGIVATAVISQITTLVIIGVVAAVLYPINLLLKPLGTFGINQFRLATAVLITIPVTVILMAITLSIELLAVRSADSIAPFLGAFASLFFGLIFGVVLILIPFVVFMVSFNKVSETFGSNDSRISDGVDIRSAPDLNTRRVQGDETESKLRYIKEFGSELPAAVAAGENSPMTEAKELGTQIAIKAAAASTNPVIAGLAAVYTGAKVVGKLTASSDNNPDGRGDNP